MVIIPVVVVCPRLEESTFKTISVVLKQFLSYHVVQGLHIVC